MTKSFFETLLVSGGFAGENFDIAVGPANTRVIDVVLSAGNGVLQIESPLTLRSTGALAVTRTLDLSSVEQDGRMLFLSV